MEHVDRDQTQWSFNDESVGDNLIKLNWTRLHDIQQPPLTPQDIQAASWE